MIKVRSPCASSSGVGGNGRFGGPLPWFCPTDAEAGLSDDKMPDLYEDSYENSGLIKL